MSKKTLGILITLASLLVGIISAAIAFLYKEDSAPTVEATNFVETNPLIGSVPSDAAIVFCVKDFERAQEYIRDSSAVFGTLFSGLFDRLMAADYPSMRNFPAILSVHYSKDMPPLLVVDAGDSATDTLNTDIERFLANADSLKLKHRTENGRIMVSSSETIINSSARHLSSGHSILEADGFSQIASMTSGTDVIFISHAYSDNILEAYFNRKHVSKASFMKEIAKWSAFSIDRHSEKGVEAHGTLLYDSDASYYTNVLQHIGSSGITVPEVLPSTTDYIFSIPIGSMASYAKAFRNYLDSQSKLDKFENDLRVQKKDKGENAEEWAKQLDINEIAVAGMHFGDRICQLLLIKPSGSRKDSKAVQEYEKAGFAQTIFGSLFKADKENAYIIKDGWMIVGDSTVVNEYLKPEFMDETLSEYLDDSGLSSRVPQKNCGFFAYYSLSEDPTLMDATFSRPMALTLRNLLKGVTYAPLTLSATQNEGKIELSLNVDRVIVTKSKAPSVDRDTTVIVPSGPFKVTNSATGKTNTLYQNSYKSICLQDENGKDLWGIPFKDDICGYVETIDYYNNGRLQFLFAAGSKLYLLDRVGRYVNGFPVDLGKEIALGPKVFDITGSSGYRAMLLFKDNTIGFYNLHGQLVDGWKGFKVSETIKSLPELAENGDDRYWIVRTSRQALVFPFLGGESLVKAEGEKMIRPDSNIKFDGKNSFTAKCYDGKDRTFKIQK